MKKVSFDCKTNFKNKIVNRKVLIKNVSIKKRNYDMYKAHVSALRLQEELKNEKKFNLRHKKEVLVEYLLYKNNLYSQITRIYRISNIRLNELIKMLLHHK